MEPSESESRITDLSAIGAENFKFRNTKFLTSEHHYYGVLEHESHIETRKRIWRVRNGDLRRLKERFPREEPIHDQCALWVRGVAGRQFFPDGNHRTAIALLRKLLTENGVPQPEWSPQAIEACRQQSKVLLLRDDPIRLDTLYERDELFDLWRQFFARELVLPTATE